MSYKNIPANVIEAIRKLIKCLEVRGYRVKEAYLFGSYAKGTWLKDSDVDLIIVSRDFEGIPFTKRLDIMNEIIWEEDIEPHIEVLPYTPREFKDKV